jgi:hypothetical protein
MVYKKKTKKRRETKKRQKIYRKNTKRKFRGGAERVNVYELLRRLTLDDKFNEYATKAGIIFYSFESSDAYTIKIDEIKQMLQIGVKEFFIDKEKEKYLVCADLLEEYEPDQLKKGIDFLELNTRSITKCKTSNDIYKACVKIRINNKTVSDFQKEINKFLTQPQVQPQVQPQEPQEPQVEDDQILQSRLDKICTENDTYCSDTKSIYSWAKRHFSRKSLDNLFKLKDDTNDEIIKALCKDILSKIDDRIQYKEWFLENCLNYYSEINYDNDDNIIEEIKLLYVTTKLKELKELNKDNDIILDWAIDNLKSNTYMFNYLLNARDTGINNFKYIIKSCFFNVHCPNLNAKIKDWFTLSSSDIFFNSILFEEDNKCTLIEQEYTKYLTSLEDKKKQKEEKERQNIINTYKGKTIEDLLGLLSAKEKDKENSQDYITSSLLPSIKKVINEIKTAIVSRKYFESQRDTLSCGRHALNNLLGRECFTFSKYNKTPMDLTIEPKSEPIDLQSLCYTMNNSIAKEYFKCLDTENYDTPLLMSALCLVKYKMTEANKEKHKIIKSNKEFKMIVNEGGRNHWVAICRYKDDSHIYYFDSLKVSPIQYTLDKFSDEHLNNTNQLWFNVVEMSEYENPISLFDFSKMN